jgi:lipopolysaccharide transport system permease protein
VKALIGKFVRYRWLFFALLVRGFKAKYKNSFLGIFWSLLNPLLNVAVFAVIFTFILKLPIKDYPLYLLCAIFPWNFFNAALTNSAVSIVEDAHFVKNTAFPAELIPLAVIAVNFVNLLIDCGILLIVLAVMGKAGMLWFYLPLLALIELVLVSGMGVFCAGAFVLFRDVNFILNVFLRLFFYFVPVIYTMELVPAKLHSLYFFNPLALLIDQFTRVLFYHTAPDPGQLILALLESLAVAGICFYVFSRFRATIPERL